MKRLFMLLMFVLPMAIASHHALAQEVTITLMPGWNWISYPNSEVMTIATALGDFTPVSGDIINSKSEGSATYLNGRWRGSLTQFTPGWGYMYYSARTESVLFAFSSPSAQVLTVTTTEPSAITTTTATCGGSAVSNDGTAILMKGVCWATHPRPTTNDSYSENGNAQGNFTEELTELTPNTVYYVRAYAVSVKGVNYGIEVSFTTEAGSSYGYVDLGLPSGTLWATCNVGADTPEGYGDYFAWGETTPKDTYNWVTYQYCHGSSSTLTKYCNNSSYGYNGFTDNLTTLLPEDDAATANLGDGWRMPTMEEFQELYNYTTITWTQQNGVYGSRFTAANGNSIFLPAAGYRLGSSLYYAGGYGYYWSSVLNTDGPVGAWYFYLGSDYYSMYINNRNFGRSVRAVRSGSPSLSFVINATANPTEGGSISGSGTYQEGANCSLTATANEGYTFTNWTENNVVVSTAATYSFTVTGNRNLVANFTVSGGSNNGYVDLGLPSGTLWATCNVGADTPEGYGDYFAWGETQPKSDYDWWTYQHCNGGELALTKYCYNSSYGYNGYTDNLTTLLPEDDAATANWGSDWRMPTKEEWQELYNNTTQTLKTQNGVYGKLFTASNGNSLFLPTAGFRTTDMTYYTGSDGLYWSSSLTMDVPGGAWYYTFYSGYNGMNGASRACGLTVRPVRSAH